MTASSSAPLIAASLNFQPLTRTAAITFRCDSSSGYGVVEDADDQHRAADGPARPAATDAWSASSHIEQCRVMTFGCDILSSTDPFATAVPAVPVLRARQRSHPAALAAEHVVWPASATRYPVTAAFFRLDPDGSRGFSRGFRAVVDERDADAGLVDDAPAPRCRSHGATSTSLSSFSPSNENASPSESSSTCTTLRSRMSSDDHVRRSSRSNLLLGMEKHDVPRVD